MSQETPTPVPACEHASRHEVAAVLRWLMTAGILPITAATVAMEAGNGTLTPDLFALLMIELLFVPALWVARQQPVFNQGLLIITHTYLYTAGVLLHYGPLFGAPFMFVATVGFSTLFAGMRGLLSSVVALFALFVFYAVGLQLGKVQPPDLSVWNLSDPFVLARMAGALLISTAAIGAVFWMLLRRLDHAVEAAEAALIRERGERARAEETSARLAAAERMETVGRLAGGVAHDFNNALAVILCSAEMLRDGTHTDPREIVGDLIAAARGAAETTQQLLTLSRKPLEHTEVVSPGEVMGRLASTLRRIFPEDISVELRCHNARSIRVSPGLLERALLNLAMNARDAMPQGGMLTLEGLEEADSVCIRVRDTGVGMEESVRARVFEPYFTTKEFGRGTGLGMAMVHGFVTEAGGTARVDSAPGAGTAITLCFPVARGPARREDLPAEAPHAVGARVLWVEDGRELRDRVRELLTEAGYVVECAPDVDGALVRLRTGASYDLLLTDAVMPGRPTSELLVIFRRACPRGRILITSGHVREELIARGIGDGRYQFLPKPFSSAELLAAVNRAISGTPARALERQRTQGQGRSLGEHGA